MTKFIALSALLATVLPAMPAHAQGQESNSVHVSYADLNLRTDAGRQSLQRRIADAARVVCVMEDSRELSLKLATKKCRTAAVQSARPAFDAAIAATSKGLTGADTAVASIIVSSH